MRITINGEPRKFEESGMTVARLLELSRVESPDMVSVQFNGRVIARERYDATMVAENDEIDFLYFMGGGTS